MNITAKEHLNQYVTERLPDLVPGIFEGAQDTPSFTVDQRNVPLRDPWYSAD